MNLQIPSFPMAGSAQVAGSKSRAKVSLQPGHSLMDWIRLGNSGKDLTGIGGKPMRVSEEELAKHNKKDDCWMAVRGIVYNVTPYMEFHPGGADELMRAAGGDGTQLFDEIHRWVNIESMLSKCLVGKLITSIIPGSRKGSTSSVRKANGLLAPPVPVFIAKPPEGPPTPRYEWLQTDSSITIIIYTKWSGIYSDHVIIDRDEKDLKVTVLVHSHVYIVHIRLTNEVKDDHRLKVSKGSGKVEVTLPKVNDGQWDSLGSSLEMDKTWKKLTETETNYRTCTVEKVTEVTHDSKLYCIALPKSTRITIPPGFHVHVKKDVEGMEICRSYTVVPPSLLADKQDTRVYSGNVFYLMIKIYALGALTPQIGLLKEGDSLEISSPEGTFDRQKLQDATHVVMFAAGTGFTPMAALTHYALHVLHVSNPMRKLKLIFFNKSEKDILWRAELDSTQEKFSNFTTTYVLSEADDSWQGHRGRISKELLEKEAFDSIDKSQDNVLICACGPTAFTKEAVRLSKEFGFTDESIHAFEA